MTNYNSKILFRSYIFLFILLFFFKFMFEIFTYLTLLNLMYSFSLVIFFIYLQCSKEIKEKNLSFLISRIFIIFLLTYFLIFISIIHEVNVFKIGHTPLFYFLYVSEIFCHFYTFIIPTQITFLILLFIFLSKSFPINKYIKYQVFSMIVFLIDIEILTYFLNNEFIIYLRAG